MTNKTNKNFKRISMFLVLMIASVFVFGITKVFSANYGSGDYCIHFDFDPNTNFEFPVTSVKVNGQEWVKANANEDIYCTTDNQWSIVVLAGKDPNNENEWPHFNTPGGFDQIGNVVEIPNPEDDPNVTGDEYKLALNLTNWEFSEEVGFFGIDLTGGGPIENPSQIETTNVSITISGDELEYHYDANDLDKADVTYFKFSINGGTEEEHLVPFRFGNANYTYNENPAPNNVSSVTTKQPIEYDYPYNGSGTVEFCVNGGATDEYTSLIINNTDYTDRVPHTKAEHWETMNGWAQQFCFNIPYSENYVVSVEGEKVEEDYIIPGFGWNYLSSERSQDVTPENEGNFAHGKLRFVSATATIDNEEVEFNSVNAFNNYRYHDKGQIFQWTDGNKQYPEEERYWSWGSCMLPVGTTLTVEIVPDRGYQLTGLAVSQNGFQATDVPGQYRITLSEENFSYNAEDNLFDLNPTFEEIGATTTVDADAIIGVTVNVNNGDDAFATGTPKLQVSNVQSMSPEREGEFTGAADAEGYEISSYVEIDLYNTLYKGGKTDGNNNYLSWDTPVHELTDNATVNLQLNEQLAGSDVALVHEVRGENNAIVGYDLIEGTYNANTKTVTFETDGFSTYAIAYKGSAPVVSEVTVSFNSNGGTAVESQTVPVGTTISEPNPSPTNGDLVFDGWYSDDTLNAPFDFTQPVNESMELFAKWNDPEEQPPESVTITFDTRCEEGMEPMIVPVGTVLEDVPEPPANGDNEFKGWYVDDTFNVLFDFTEPINSDVSVVALWEEPETPKEHYSIDSEEGGFAAEFTEEAGKTYHLNVVNYLAFTKEEVMAAAGISEEEYEAAFGGFKEAVKNEGTLVGVFEIMLEDQDGFEPEGPITIKIPLTPEMKQYKNLSLVYYADDGSTEKAITLSVSGDYAVGTLQHLSMYLMAGNNNSNSSQGNPKTFDDIGFWVAGLIVSLLGVSYLLYSLKKTKTVFE